MVILMLIAFTLIPPIINLLSSAGTVPLNYNFLFVMLFILTIFTAHTLTRGVLKSLLPLIALFTGSLAYCTIFKTYNPFNSDLVIFGLPQSFLGPAFHPRYRSCYLFFDKLPRTCYKRYKFNGICWISP